MCNNNNNNLLYQNTCISLSIKIACRIKTCNGIPKAKLLTMSLIIQFWLLPTPVLTTRLSSGCANKNLTSFLLFVSGLRNDYS
jgi:hypothetical protein